MSTEHLVSTEHFEVAASPERVFPLLCPVREHDWIPTWRAEVVHSRSGVAELDCVFTTSSPGEGQRTWICTRYEPNRAIQYTSFSSVGYLMRLDITLEARDEHTTRICWSRAFIAANAEGRGWLAALSPAAVATATMRIAKLLDYYLRTGTMLRS